MSTAELSGAVEELLKSFELLPEREKHQVASEIVRRTLAATTKLDDAHLAALYAEFAEMDGKLAEEGIEDYERGLVSEDAE
jgi:hypothetical protein